MGLKKKGEARYGDAHHDIREVLIEYSAKNGHITSHFGDATCHCGNRMFRLSLDDETGAAVRICKACGDEHAIGDSQDYLDVAELEECECPCGSEFFEITAGVALYEASQDVKWLYLGCRCPECSQVACYGDWKNEYLGYRELLRLV